MMNKTRKLYHYSCKLCNNSSNRFSHEYLYCDLCGSNDIFVDITYD